MTKNKKLTTSAIIGIIYRNTTHQYFCFVEINSSLFFISKFISASKVAKILEKEYTVLSLKKKKLVLTYSRVKIVNSA